jgi:hypothetical protein
LRFALGLLAFLVVEIDFRLRIGGDGSFTARGAFLATTTTNRHDARGDGGRLRPRRLSAAAAASALAAALVSELRQ